MNPDELEQRLRTLWTRSQVPLNRDNLIAYTGLSERKLDRELGRLVERGALRVEAESGERRWEIPGEIRPMDGPESLGRFERLQAMRAEARARVRAARGGQAETGDAESQALAKREPEEKGGRSMIRAAGGLAKGALGLVSSAAAPLDKRRAKKDKSLLLSAGLSLFGPLGWLYAGSLREAVPASLLFLLIAWILPNPILWPLLWFVLPISSIGGLLYAWQHNRHGHRTPLLLGSDEDDE